MPAIPLSRYAYRRENGRLPSVRLLNMYFEATPANLTDQVALLTRPALEPFAEADEGPTRGLLWEDDVFGSDILWVSGDNLYRVGPTGTATSIGEIPGSYPVEIAASPTEALLANVTELYVTDGSTVIEKDFPPGGARTVGYLNGYFLAVGLESHRLYYTDLTTGEFSADRYISAERYADDIRRIVVVGDEVWAFGAASVEVFIPTGVDTADEPPFQRVEGRLYRRGVLNTATIVLADDTVFWVGQSSDDGYVVYRGDSRPLPVSDTAVAEAIGLADPGDMHAWVFGMNGHTFYVLGLGAQGTWAFDITTKLWTNWTTFGQPDWRPRRGLATLPGNTVCGDSSQGILWRLSATALTDDDTPIEQVFTAAVPVEGRPINTSVEVDCAVGQAESGVTPKLYLQVSDDQGRTWADEFDAPLGRQGEYDTRTRWDRLGQMTAPMRIYEFRTADPVRLRISQVRINDAL